MAYQVDDSDVAEQVAGWPMTARARFDEVRTVLELTPWNSRSANRSNPDGQFRFLTFATETGFGVVYFVVVEHASEVSITDVVWHE